jgi:glycosyltransferase involved in cell wall biosynthesis
MTKANAWQVLFVGHEATRTGAPLILLHFLKWFAREVRWPFQVLLARGGELVKDFADVGATAVLDDGLFESQGLLRSGLRRTGLDALGERLQGMASKRRLGPHPNVIYCNSVASAVALDVIRAHGQPLLTHVHELDYSFRVSLPRVSVERLLRSTRRFVACAGVVRDYLVDREGIPAAKIDVVHEFLLPGRTSGVDLRTLPPKLLSPSGAPYLVACVGSVGWRKGTDLFIQVARILHRRMGTGSVDFLWVGHGERESLAHAEHEIRLAGLQSVVTIRGAVEDPAPYYAAMDVLLLPSREDPYPLVCLEAAAAGKPIVCFDRGGGAKELVETDAGFVVPYLDVAAMAERVIELLRDADLRGRMGGAARRKVTERHSLEITAPKLFAALERTLTDGSS